MNNLSKIAIQLECFNLPVLVGASFFDIKMGCISYDEYDRLPHVFEDLPLLISLLIDGVKEAVSVLQSKITLNLIGDELKSFNPDCFEFDGEETIDTRIINVTLAFHILDFYALTLMSASLMKVEIPSMYDVIEEIPFHRLTPLNKKRRGLLEGIPEGEQYMFPWYVFFSSEEYDEKKVTIPEISAWHADATADKEFLSYWSILESNCI